MNTIGSRWAHFNALAAGQGAQLIAVSKTWPVEKLQEAYDAGCRVFGENKVQELVPKYEAMSKDIEWHLIGHLQSNKVKYIAPFVHTIHSVDSVKLLDEIEKQASKAGRVIQVLYQVFIAQEETKFGMDENELAEALAPNMVQSHPHCHIVGLMGMASNTADKNQVVKEFSALKGLCDKYADKVLFPYLSFNQLSMGMSGDYEEALACGSTYIRLGSVIFGNR